MRNSVQSDLVEVLTNNCTALGSSIEIRGVGREMFIVGSSVLFKPVGFLSPQAQDHERSCQ